MQIAAIVAPIIAVFALEYLEAVAMDAHVPREVDLARESVAANGTAEVAAFDVLFHLEMTRQVVVGQAELVAQPFSALVAEETALFLQVLRLVASEISQSREGDVTFAAVVPCTETDIQMHVVVVSVEVALHRRDVTTAVLVAAELLSAAVGAPVVEIQRFLGGELQMTLGASKFRCLCS